MRVVRRFVLGTAGHVDHGKTSLVRALTGVDTDRLPEEKRRGITIELGFAPWDLGDGLSVSLIDVPGHRRLVHTMIAGAIGMELLLLVVAADEGVMPQTREHIAASELLGIRRAVVAVTKLDRVGREVAELAGDEARELLGDRWEAEVVCCSSRTGEGIEDVRSAVRRALARLPPPRSSARARLSVDRVFSVKGTGTVVTGTLVEGKIATGAPLFLVGEGGVQPTAARGLHVHDQAVAVAEAPTRLAVNLAGLALEAVHRGDVLTDDRSARVTRVIDVRLRAEEAIRRGSSAQIYVGTARSSGRIDLLRDVASEAPAEAAKGARVVARLRLSSPMVVLGGDRFVMRGSDVDGPAGAVLGGGDVLDADPPGRRPRDKRASVLASLAAGDAPATVRALVDEAAPQPFPQTALAARFSLSAAELRRAADALTGKGELAALKGSGWMAAARLVDLAITARSLVAEHHKKAPLDRGLGLSTLRQKLADLAGADAAAEAIKMAAGKLPGQKGDAIVIDGDVARLASFGAVLADRDLAGALSTAEKTIHEAGLKGVSEFGVKEATGATPKEVKAILAKVVRDGAAVHAGELWFSRPSVEELRGKVLALLARSSRMTIAEFKDLSGLGRKQAIVLLEHFDREGTTRREGDDRVAGSR
ncbi:Selenocysteine-specific translation elongation factor [Minicystis rosea]|nr:Selenocysteine-specific translation elongation factor [Minicystis rosea]